MDIFQDLPGQFELLEVSLQKAQTDMERRQVLRRMRVLLVDADKAISLDEELCLGSVTGSAGHLDEVGGSVANQPRRRLLTGQRWIELAAEAATEHDPARLLSLVTELNNLLLQGPSVAPKPSDASELR